MSTLLVSSEDSLISCFTRLCHIQPDITVFFLTFLRRRGKKKVNTEKCSSFTFLLSFRLWTGTLLLSRPRLLAFRLVCRHRVTANLKWRGGGRMRVLHQFSSLWPSDWTLSVAGSNFTVRQLHPAGCVLGVPSVVWELCLQDTPAPGGFYTL